MEKKGLADNQIAVYWDFENIHASLYDTMHGENSYHHVRFQPQENVLDIGVVVDYASSLGVVSINKAYADWRGFSKYRENLMEKSIDLYQIFPKGMKNSSDMKLALDAYQDLMLYDHITDVIIVSSDSDFINLAQKIRQLGKRVIGVGVRDFTNPFWINACNEFKFYETLKMRSQESSEVSYEQTEDVADFDYALGLMVKSLKQLSASRSADLVPRGSLKTMMQRNDPSFDEANYGLYSFGEFVKKFPDMVENIDDHSGGMVKLKDGAESRLSETGEVEPSTDEPESGKIGVYMGILKKGNYKPLPTPWWRKAVEQVEDLFRESDNRLASFSEFKSMLPKRLRDAGLDDDPDLIQKLKSNLYTLYQYYFIPGGGICLKSLQFAEGDSLQKRVDSEIVRRLAKFGTSSVEEEPVAMILFGECNDEILEYLRPIIEKQSNQY
jgi:uncharacterized LabA/DUF88 family protein